MTDGKQSIRIKGQEYLVSAADVIAVTKHEEPRRVNSYYVEINGRRFPPKQLLRGAIRESVSFDTGVAVRTLRALGFEVMHADSPQD